MGVGQNLLPQVNTDQSGRAVGGSTLFLHGIKHTDINMAVSQNRTGKSSLIIQVNNHYQPFLGVPRLEKHP